MSISILSWLIASLFLFYDILLRVFPNILVGQLQHQFHIDAAALGELSAAFMWGMFLLQIPAGQCINVFGLKRATTAGALCITSGLLIFTITHQFALACFSRFLMGAGAAFAFPACLQVIEERIHVKHRSLFLGLTMTIGACAGIFSNSVLIHFANNHTWKMLLATLTLSGGILTLLTVSFIRNKQPLQRKNFSWTQFKPVLQLCKNKQLLLIGLIAATIYLPYAVFNDLWGVPFFRVVDHMTKPVAGQVISTIWLGWLIGSPILGLMADRFGKKNMLIIATFAQVIVLSGLLFAHLSHHHDLILILAFSLGITASSMFLTYMLGLQIDHKRSATTGAIINAMVTLVVLISLPLIGRLMDYFSGKAQLAKLTVLQYPISDFRTSLSVLLIGLCFALIFSYRQPKSF